MGRTTRIAVLGVLLSGLLASAARAQITPPGLGNAQTAAWLASGVRQKLGDRGRFSYLGYVGLGSTSARHDADPWRRPAIFVLNHELYDRFSAHWMYSLAVSYRRQNVYESEGSAWREERLQELRAYARFSHVLARGRFELLSTVRPELRGFTEPRFAAAEHPLQLRLRLKEQLVTRLDPGGDHRVILSAEALASMARARRASPEGWGAPAYRESRFAAFYSLRAGETCVIDVGYMNDLIGRRHAIVDVHYLAVDVIWTNLFGRAPT